MTWCKSLETIAMQGGFIYFFNNLKISFMLKFKYNQSLECSLFLLVRIQWILASRIQSQNGKIDLLGYFAVIFDNIAVTVIVFSFYAPIILEK